MPPSLRVSEKVQLKTFRCHVCGTADEFPADSTREDVARGCGVCYIHAWHRDDRVSPFCAMCAA